MATGVVSWSQTAATNATADTAVNWAEGQAPSTVNDSARAMMASVAKWRDDLAGALTTGGTSTAYTLTTNQVFASLSAMSGQTVRVKMSATNNSNATLNVDGLGAKAIVTVTGTAVPIGSLQVNQIYNLTYANSSSEWILNESYVNNLYAPAGTVMIFGQTSAPTGWTKGSSLDDAALRLTTGAVSTGGSTVFTSVFGSRTIAQANLPSYNLSTASISLTVSGTQAKGFNAARSVYNAVVTTGGAGTVPQDGSVTDIAVGGTIPSGGSGTALDFAVKYQDVIQATKN